MEQERPRILLMCHDDELLDRLVMPRWIASFATLAGLMVIREGLGAKIRRARRELSRVGIAGFLDVLAFRAWYGLFLASRDRRWEVAKIKELCDRYPEIPAGTPVRVTASPNAPSCEKCVRKCRSDVMIARCKFILKKKVFGIPVVCLLTAIAQAVSPGIKYGVPRIPGHWGQ